MFVRFSRLLCLACAVPLCSCTSTGQTLADAVRLIRPSGLSSVDKVALDPRFRYLRVAVGQRATVLMLGYVDNDPSGPVETWYAGGGKETLRLQNGRLIGATNMPVEWRAVRLSAQPAWASLTAPQTLTRQRDVMPGYQYSLSDTLRIAPVLAPADSPLAGKPIPDLHWFAETSSGPAALPAARYAVAFEHGQASVVYGEQCLSNTFCISWQRWPS